jgi:hypothetical protein
MARLKVCIRQASVAQVRRGRVETRTLTPESLSYLIASGLVGEPTAPVIGIAGATNMNS